MNSYNYPMPDSSPHKPTRRTPIPVTLTLVVFGLWTLLGWLRFARVIIQRDLILATLPTGLFWYLLLAGLIWGLVSLPVLWGLVRRKAYALKALWIAGLLYPAVYWVERIFLWRDPAARDNWPFMLVLTILWLGLMTWTSLSNKVRKFLNQDRQADERSS